MNLRQQKKQETKKLLLETAKQLFNQQDYESVTIDNITETAGISRKTFFNYFASKAILLEEVIIEWVESSSIWAWENATIKDAESALIPSNISKITDWVIENRRILKMVNNHTQLFHATLNQQGRYQAKIYATSGKPRLERVLQAQSLGFIRNDIEAGIICHMYDTLRLDAVRHWLLQSDDDCKAEDFHHYYNGLKAVLLKGIEP